MAEIDGNHYHVVPEAVYDGTCVYMCAHCRRGFNPQQRAIRQERDHVGGGDAGDRGGEARNEAGADEFDEVLPGLTHDDDEVPKCLHPFPATEK